MSLSYCGATVRKHDPDRFLLSLFAPADRREDLWALYAFNHEIAKTREVVTETKLGLIRLQWWRDALTNIYDGKPPLKHQVVEPLAAAIAAHKLPKELFESLIFAREFDLEDRLPATLEGMVNYADFTATPLVKLALMVEGVTAEEGAVKAAGTAYALTGLLRAMPAHLRQRRCYLPEDMLHKAGTDQYDLYDLKGLEKLKPVTQCVAAEATKNLNAVSAPRSLRVMQTMTALYLRQIEKAGYDLFSPAMQVPVPLLAFRLWWKNLF